MTNESLKYHFHPKKGWLNDPNGLCFFKGEYHIFFQHTINSEQPWNEPMTWGHATTTNFINYKELPIALSCDTNYDINGCWSGTAIEKDGVLYCFYASINQDNKQVISMATSRDGVNFIKYKNNPIISTYPSDGSNDFRDPAVFTENGIVYLVIASADVNKKTGNLLLYKSEDMYAWEYCGVLHEYQNSKFCECPSFVKLGDKYLLSCSVVRLDESHYFEIMYGSFDGKKFVPEITSHLQKGPHEYAGQIFQDPKGRAILMSWIPGWWSAKYTKCIGCLSLPLEITKANGVLKAYPIKEVRHLLNENDELTDSYVKETFVNRGEEVYIHILGAEDN